MRERKYSDNTAAPKKKENERRSDAKTGPENWDPAAGGQRQILSIEILILAPKSRAGSPVDTRDTSTATSFTTSTYHLHHNLGRTRQHVMCMCTHEELPTKKRRKEEERVTTWCGSESLTSRKRYYDEKTPLSSSKKIFTTTLLFYEDCIASIITSAAPR